MILAGHKQCLLCGGVFPLGPHQCTPKPPEVRLNEDGTLDEIVAFGAYVHLEQMDDGHWWLAVESDGHLVHINLATKRGAPIHASVDDPA